MSIDQTDKYFTYFEDIQRMTRISESDFELFQTHKDFFIKYAEPLVNFILEVLSENYSTRRVFEEGRGDADKLVASVSKWLLEIIGGHDTPQFWQRHYLIGIQHIKRQIPNRQMMGLATRIREFVLPVMLSDLGPERGLALFLAFQRFLDTVVALTSTLVEVGQKRCLIESTGFSEKLIDKLQSMVFSKISEELRFPDN